MGTKKKKFTSYKAHRAKFIRWEKGGIKTHLQGMQSVVGKLKEVLPKNLWSFLRQKHAA